MTIRCDTLERYGVWDTKNCCASCHDDLNEGVVPVLLALGDPRKTPVLWEWSDVCCGVIVSEEVPNAIKEMLKPCKS